MKFKKLNESSLVDKKVSTLGKNGKPMYFTDDQLKDAKAKYPEYDFEETTVEYSLPQGQKAYIAKKKVTEDIGDSGELEANKMTIMPLAGINSDGFTVVINNAAGEELFKKEYRYGYDASYKREFARRAEKDYNDSIKYGWKTSRTLKPYVADIVDELCIKYGIDKNSIEFVPGKNIFNGGSVTGDFVDSMKKLVYEAKQIKAFGAKAKKLNEVVYTGKKMKDKSRIKKELEDKIYNAFIKLALSPTWGYDDKKEVEFYIMPKVEVSDYTENDFDFKVEFRAELSYSELVEACETLDKIVMKYDKNAYFEPVQPGIADAFITLPKDLNESVREYTNKLLDMVDEGIVDKDILIRELLNYMSEDEVKDFVITNEYDD